ncbi:MAG: glycosyltransferase [Campylobacterota bacterium]|nr:glycosyltransferase [Campylobacterota bacterium]
MRIVLFTDTIGDLNGVSRFLQDMAEIALRKNDDLQIVTSTNKYYPATDNIHNFPPRFHFPMPFYNELDIAFPPRAMLEEFVIHNMPDLIHISTPGPVGMAGRKIAMKLDIPILGTYHTDFPAYIWDNTGSRLLKRVTDRWMNHFYSPFVHVFSRSKIYGKIMQEDIAISSDKISYIRPGTNLERFSPLHTNKKIWNVYGLNDETLKVLYVGRVTIEKNVPFLLDIWRILQRSNPELNAELIVVGEGKCKKDVLEMKSMGVHYLGPVIGDKLSLLYASSDLFVFPSLTDTLGQVVMESSASALPVIVSTTGGPKSLINLSPKSGYALDINSEVWVEHIRLLCEDGKQRESLGRSAQEHMQNYPIENSYEDFMGAHRRYLGL